MKNWQKILLLLLFIVSFPPVVISLEPYDLPKRLIVRFKPDVSEQVAKTELTRLDILKKEKLELANTYSLVAEAKKIGETIKQLAATKKIEYIEPDYVAQALETPDDPYLYRQWGLTKIAAQGAWEVTHGSPVQIAIVDTGISDHPDLQSKITVRKNFTTDSDIDGSGHGTHVAGIAGAITNNSLGISGVGYESKLMSVKVLSNTGFGYYSWIANGIVWAADNGADIINLSLGGSYDSRTVSEAVAYAGSRGVMIVAAAGNDSTSTPTFPAYYESVIAVAATDNFDRKASFSSYGNWVDVAAPGVSILSTYRDYYKEVSGTSMAAPFVSGVAALIKSVHPGWSNTEIRNKLEQTTDKITQTGSYWVWGRVNACRAVDCPESSLVSPLPSPLSSPSPVPTIMPTPIPTPTPSPQPGPFASSPTVYITSYSVQKEWHEDDGQIGIDLTTRVSRGTWTKPLVKIIPDQKGVWNTVNHTVNITIDNKSYQIYPKWDEKEKSLTLDLTELDLSIVAGKKVILNGIDLENDTRGFHTLKLQVIEGSSLLRERTVTVSL